MSTWWIHEPSVRGSSNPTNEDLETLRAQGFNVVVSLLYEKEQRPRYDLKRAQALGYVRRSIPIRDFVVRQGQKRDGAPTLAQLLEFTKLMESIPPGSKVLIHCQGGNGRTGAMAAAYWIAKCMTADAAIQQVRSANPCAIETPEQEAVLREFASQLHNARRETN
jgi:protein-tyrosine phosphatase